MQTRLIETFITEKSRMNRFHVHVNVDDIKTSIPFYSKLFGAEPTRVESDYAKWMIEDPRLNFAISSRGASAGIDHLGIQTDTPGELQTLHERARAADMSLLDEGETTCCYARSDKHWITDPQGVAWEHFHTLANIPVFTEATSAEAASGSACCASGTRSATSAVPAAAEEPAPRGKPIRIPVKAANSWC